jgi:NADH-quinone oxidoreductase subunit A
MELYAPVFVLGAIGAAFVAVSMLVGAIAGPKRYNRAKMQAYECGIEPTPQPAGGGRFTIKYYLTAMLFIVFDIEIIFLYPWAVHFDELGLFGRSRWSSSSSTCRSPTPTSGAAEDWSGTDRTGTDRAPHPAPARRTRQPTAQPERGFAGWALRRNCRAASC